MPGSRAVRGAAAEGTPPVDTLCAPIDVSFRAKTAISDGLRRCHTALPDIGPVAGSRPTAGTSAMRCTVTQHSLSL